MTRRHLIASAASPLLAAVVPPLESEVKIDEVCTVPSYCEGIVFDRAGDAYISHGRFISRVARDGKPVTWAETGAPNGHKVLPDGTHIVCDASQHAVLHLDANGKVIGKAAAACDGKPLRGPNDCTLDPKGGFYFTDPGGGSTVDKPIGTVHHVSPTGEVRLCASDFPMPNGIVLRPDGSQLLFGDSLRNTVYVCDVAGPGRVSAPREFARLPQKGEGQINNLPDGMCLDEAGNLYVAHWGMRQVQVVDRRGMVIRRYPGGNLTTSNVAFGGPARDTLYITGALKEEGKSPGGLFRIRLAGVHGVQLLKNR
ncbi:MAG: SMP-30/gluconolactonase/LRE family protein [Candidatus Hydrogenedentes bacterium]|nr:SMP-30/gluconolactonase/LRE family protein [Candidatus Hydrogenedentota bacterium]